MAGFGSGDGLTVISHLIELLVRDWDGWWGFSLGLDWGWGYVGSPHDSAECTPWIGSRK